MLKKTCFIFIGIVCLCYLTFCQTEQKLKLDPPTYACVVKSKTDTVVIVSKYDGIEYNGETHHPIKNSSVLTGGISVLYENSDFYWSNERRNFFPSISSKYPTAKCALVD